MTTIICVSGLGGKANIFNKFKSSLSRFNLELINVINWPEAQRTIDDIVEKNPTVIFLCNCYGSQFALRVMERHLTKVSGLMVVEPFFGEFLPCRNLILVVNRVVLFFMRLTDLLGLQRRKFPKIDYGFVERWPLFFHPFFDIKHQSMTDYFGKIDDILTFKLPARIETKTLFLFSPRGFIRDQKKRERLKNVFVHAELVEVGKEGHNIMTLSYKEITETISNWLSLNLSK